MNTDMSVFMAPPEQTNATGLRPDRNVYVTVLRRRGTGENWLTITTLRPHAYYFCVLFRSHECVIIQKRNIKLGSNEIT